MACVKSDGSLTGSAKAILTAISGPSRSPDDIVNMTGLPFFRVRSGLREMEEIGLVTRSGSDEFTISPMGERRLAGPEEVTSSGKR